MQPILYAEDDENDAFLMQRAFRQAGVTHPLKVVPDGNMAVAYLEGSGLFANREEHPLPCLVILDLKMPGKSGFQVLSWLRSQPNSISLPALVLTSSNQDTDVQKAYQLGANGYLIKPGRPDELLKLVSGIKDYWLSENRAPDVDGAAGRWPHSVAPPPKTSAP